MKKYLLFIILLMAALLRLWHLGSNPPGLTPDEAALGYNAYSILHTGHDEFGKFLPIIFKSFGDYKPGLYVYLTIPSVAVFGLNEFATRLPSALAGVFSVFLIYLITKKLFGSIETGRWRLESIAAVVAACNPYLIYFSRGAWEANVSLTLTLAGIFFFLQSINKNKYILLSALFFALTLLTYQGAKLSTIIVLLLLAIIYWKECWKISKKYLTISILFGVLVSFPIILSLFNGQTQRLTIFSIFSYSRPKAEIQNLLNEGQEKVGDLNYDLFHSNGLNFSRAILGRYFNNFSGRFLFFEGDWANPISTAPYQGVLLLSDMFFIPFGLFAIFKSKLGKGHYLFMFWLILAPLSAALSRDEINAVRDLNLAVPFIVVIAFGIFETIMWMKRQTVMWLKVIIYGVFVVFYLFSFIYFVDALFVHLPIHNSSFWRYGYKQAVNYITPVESKYKDIVFEQSFNQPYIYFLFYQKYDPLKYQKQANLVNSQYKGDVGFETTLDNIHFERVDWSVLRNAHNTLVFVSPGGTSPEVINNPNIFRIIGQIKYRDNFDIAFNIIEIK